MKQVKIFVLLMLSIACASVAAAPRTNILSVDFTDEPLIEPSSFATDTHKMLENWYLQNVAIIDRDADSRADGEVSESEYIRRLQALPNVIEMPYNDLVRAFIDRYMKRNRTLVAEMLGMSLYYMPIFESALEREGLPLELKYLPVVESALNPTAGSHAGAKGIWQFMSATARGMGLEVSSVVDERFDPYRSSEAAAKYLKQLYGMYHNWHLALAAYNCGPGGVNRAIDRAKSNGISNPTFWDAYSYLPRETRSYVPAFIAANYAMNYYSEHNIRPALARKPLVIDTVAVNNRVHFDQISAVLGIPVDEIKALNPQYLSNVIPGNRHTYMLALPSMQTSSFVLAEDSILAYNKKKYEQPGRVDPNETSPEDEILEINGFEETDAFVDGKQPQVSTQSGSTHVDVDVDDGDDEGDDEDDADDEGDEDDDEEDDDEEADNENANLVNNAFAQAEAQSKKEAAEREEAAKKAAQKAQSKPSTSTSASKGTTKSTGSSSKSSGGKSTAQSSKNNSKSGKTSSKKSGNNAKADNKKSGKNSKSNKNTKKADTKKSGAKNAKANNKKNSKSNKKADSGKKSGKGSSKSKKKK